MSGACACSSDSGAQIPAPRGTTATLLVEMSAALDARQRPAHQADAKPARLRRRMLANGVRRHFRHRSHISSARAFGRLCIDHHLLSLRRPEEKALGKVVSRADMQRQSGQGERAPRTPWTMASVMMSLRAAAIAGCVITAAIKRASPNMNTQLSGELVHFGDTIDTAMRDAQRAFPDAHTCLLAPWAGPAPTASTPTRRSAMGCRRAIRRATKAFSSARFLSSRNHSLYPSSPSSMHSRGNVF